MLRFVVLSVQGLLKLTLASVISCVFFGGSSNSEMSAFCLSLFPLSYFFRNVHYMKPGTVRLETHSFGKALQLALSSVLFALDG